MQSRRGRLSSPVPNPLDPVRRVLSFGGRKNSGRGNRAVPIGHKGEPWMEAAASANITVKTGRTYLERIFAKTGTRQQS